MTKNETFQRIQRELKDHHVVLFMKGTPSHPRCGFSAEASKKLQEAGVVYKSVVCGNVGKKKALYEKIIFKKGTL